MMNNLDPAADRTLTLERVFDVPVSLVWEAWTQAEHIVHWWAPQGMEVNVVEHDFGAGGKWRYTMQMPDGQQFTSAVVAPVSVPLISTLAAKRGVPV